MMRGLDIRGLSVVAWGVLNAALVGVIGVELGGMTRPAVEGGKLPGLAAEPVEARLLPEYVLPAPEHGYKATVARPLFVPTRRPAPPLPPPPPVTHEPEAVPSKPSMKKGQFQLMGVILTNEKRIALLRETAGGKMYKLFQGGEINGMRLESVDKERVRLTQYDDHEDLVLKVQPSPKPSVAPAKPAMPPRATGARPAGAGVRSGGEADASTETDVASAPRERSVRAQTRKMRGDQLNSAVSDRLRAGNRRVNGANGERGNP